MSSIRHCKYFVCVVYFNHNITNFVKKNNSLPLFTLECKKYYKLTYITYIIEQNIYIYGDNMNRKITLLILSIFIVAVAVGAAVAAEAKTNTEIKMLSEKTLKNGDDIEFQLKDAKGNVIASQKVNISFEANGKFENYSVITDKDGKGYLVLTNEATGDHKVIINYSGNSKYNPSKLEETITIKEGESTSEKTNVNSTASTIQYDNSTANKTTNSSNDEPLFYDAEYNFYYNKYGIVVGGQNDGANAADLVDTYREGEARGSDYLE